MLFNSGVFVVVFLPIVVIGYYLINKINNRSAIPYDLIWLFLMSLIFYGYEKPIFVLLIVLSIVWNYLCTRMMNRFISQKKFFLVLGLLFNFGLLFYFKYFNFFMENVYALTDKYWAWKNIFLPLGISFFTFQQVSFLVDYYRDSTAMEYSFWEYAAFVSFFPQLVAGPIVLHQELIPQFRDSVKKRINYDNLCLGMYAFSIGLAKKVLIADTLSKVVAIGMRDFLENNTGTGVVVMAAYTLQIYFDFSGYCDMAIGIAKLFNFSLPINFNSPYKAGTIREFWKRWHLTLTRFFTNYVYIPLGGSRKGKLRTYWNTFFIFLLSGLWHGANWTFICWGMLHGLLMTAEKMIADLTKNRHIFGQKIWKGIYRVWVLVFINVSWMIFRSDSLVIFRIFMQRLANGSWNVISQIPDPINKKIEFRMLARLGLGRITEVFPSFLLIAFLICCWIGVLCMKNIQEKMENFTGNWKTSLVTIVLLVWSIFSFSDVGEFLYFNF